MSVRAVKLARTARRPGLWRGLRHGVLAATEHAPVAFAPETRTVLDVGASRGQFALFAADRFPTARIVCFEPLEPPRRRLARVLGDRVEVHAVALGAEPGTATLHVAAADDSSSLLPIGARQVREFPGTRPAGTVRVPVARLDAYLVETLPGPRLLKLDVQGFELEVLRGAGDALGLAAQVYAECSFVELYDGQPLADEIVHFLARAGFRLAGVHNLVRSRDGSAVQADFLFARR